MKNRILYFVKGPVPTNEEFLKAEPLQGKGPFLHFVSLEAIDLNGPLLENVGVAGAVPEEYKEFPVVDKKTAKEEKKSEK